MANTTSDGQTGSNLAVSLTYVSRLWSLSSPRLTARLRDQNLGELRYPHWV